MWVTEVGKCCCIRREGGGCSLRGIASARWIAVGKDPGDRHTPGFVEVFDHCDYKIVSLNNVGRVRLEKDFPKVVGAISNFDTIDERLGGDESFNGLHNFGGILVGDGDFVSQWRGK